MQFNIQSSTPGVSVVLVCWNNKDYLEQCLSSLFAEDLNFTFEVVVVDNGSIDGSQQMLSEKFPQVLLIQNDSNVGLSRASNQGILSTSGDYILLLNNDTIVNKYSLDNVVDFIISHPDAGAVGGNLLNPDGSFQASFNSFPNLLQEFLIVSGLGRLFREHYPTHRKYDEVKVVDWISSAFLLIRRCMIDQIGLLDEQFFIYGDETDFQYRLKKSGWKVYYLPNVSIVHYGGKSMHRWSRRKMVYRGKLLFFKKNYSSVSNFFLRLMISFFSAIKAIIWVLFWLFPQMRERSAKEILSNLEVIRLSLSSEIENPVH